MRRSSLSLSFVALVLLTGGCGSSSPKPAGQSTGGVSGSGGKPGSGGRPGSGGAAQASGGQLGSGGGAGGSAGAGPGTGGQAPDPDAGSDVTVDPGDSAPPPPLPPEMEKPLPACKKTVEVANNAALGGALSAAQAGDCLVLADGTYTFPAISKKGTADAPIVIRAKNRGMAEIPSGNLNYEGASYVVVEGVKFTSSGSINFNNSDYCRLTRVRFIPTNQVGNDWVTFNGTSHHNRVDRCEFGPKTVLGNTIMFSGPGDTVSPDNRIDHNFFHDIKGGGGNGWETLRIGLSSKAQSKAHTIVEFNLFKAATGDPETISVKSSENIIRYNTYRATTGEITLRHGNGTLVYGNFMLADGNAEARGMRVLGANHRIFNNYLEGIKASNGIFLRSGSADGTDQNGTEFYRVYRTHIVNNTLVDSKGVYVGSTGLAPVDCVVANNIVVNPSGAAYVDVGQNTKVEGNVFSGGMGGLTAGVQMMDPMLVKVDGIFRLGPGSPAIDAAVGTYDYVTDDMDGQPRTKTDLGADELVMGGVITRRALTEADVGLDAP
jgi:poly(beta-D-mannuronate) lyase